MDMSVALMMNGHELKQGNDVAIDESQLRFETEAIAAAPWIILLVQFMSVLLKKSDKCIIPRCNPRTRLLG